MGKTRIFEIDHTGYAGPFWDLVGRAVAGAKQAHVYVPSDGEIKALRDPAYEQTVRVVFAGNFRDQGRNATPEQQRALFMVLDEYGLSGQDDVNRTVVKGVSKGALRGLGRNLMDYDFVANAVRGGQNELPGRPETR